MSKYLDWQHVIMAVAALGAICYMAAQGLITDGETVTALLGVTGIGTSTGIALAASKPQSNGDGGSGTGSADGGDTSVLPQ